MNRPRVFLSYSFQDRLKVEQIADALISNGIDIWQDYQFLKPGTDWKKEIKYKIQSSEILIVFLSKNYLNSEWSNYELKEFLRESEKRNISIIPIALEKTKIPFELLNYQIINLSNNEQNLENLLYKLKAIPEITFDHFTPIEFEKFVGDFLKEFGFSNIVSQELHSDYGFDYKAEYKSKNPFGILKTEHWIIEIKFYKQDRFSINSIKQLLDYKRQLFPVDLKLLFVTNSILTSVAEDYLRDFQKIENTQIDVIDGQILKRLVVTRKRLLDKYFSI